MARDALPIVLAVRRRAIDEARSALGLCLREEARIAGQLDAMDAAIRRNSLLDASFPERVYFLDILAEGHQRAQNERLELNAGLDAARTRTAEARTAVADARLAAEAVEQLIDDRKAAAASLAEKQAQHALDDLGTLLRARRQALAGRNPGHKRDA